MMYILSCVVHKFFFLAGLVHQHPDLALFGADDHRLAAHTADHIKWIHRPAPERQFQGVLLHAALQSLLQLVGDLEKAIRRAQAADALVGAFVVVIFDPESTPLHRLFEAVELGPLEELAQD
jgi:peptidoglycan/xylan/chitin deacetylase (PgdA/CDA1 family)